MPISVWTLMHVHVGTGTRQAARQAAVARMPSVQGPGCGHPHPWCPHSGRCPAALAPKWHTQDLAEASMRVPTSTAQVWQV
eukprot:359517-Chlamydomonas_euryale.AAC.37